MGEQPGDVHARLDRVERRRAHHGARSAGTTAGGRAVAQSLPMKTTSASGTGRSWLASRTSLSSVGTCAPAAWSVPMPR